MNSPAAMAKGQKKGIAMVDTPGHVLIDGTHGL
jgi:hypothetical protein